MNDIHEEVYKKDGKWESWTLQDSDGRVIRYRNHFDGEFNSELENRYDGQGRLIYRKTNSVNWAVQEQWFQPDKTPYIVLRRGVDSKGNPYWMGEDGMHTTEEMWNKALSELEKA